MRPPPTSTLFPYTTLFRSAPPARPARPPPRRSSSSLRGSGRSTCHPAQAAARQVLRRSEEHTSELQSLTNLVCRLLLEKKKVTSAAAAAPLDRADYNAPIR